MGGIRFSPMISPCSKDCPKRVPLECRKTCPEWAKFEEQKQKYYSRPKDDIDIPTREEIVKRQKNISKVKRQRRQRYE